MFTAMYDYEDIFGALRSCNCKIGGFKDKQAAINAVLKKSPINSGEIRIGLTIDTIIKDGKIFTAT
jgi:hypothetical protein